MKPNPTTLNRPPRALAPLAGIPARTVTAAGPAASPGAALLVAGWLRQVREENQLMRKAEETAFALLAVGAAAGLANLVLEGNQFVTGFSTFLQWAAQALL